MKARIGCHTRSEIAIVRDRNPIRHYIASYWTCYCQKGTRRKPPWQLLCKCRLLYRGKTPNESSWGSRTQLDPRSVEIASCVTFRHPRYQTKSTLDGMPLWLLATSASLSRLKCLA